MKRRLATLVAAAAVFGAAPAVAPVVGASPLAPASAVAHTCSTGYTHAHLPWGQKCLRRGQFCKGDRDRVYHRYGYHCHKRDSRGNYHLS